MYVPVAVPAVHVRMERWQGITVDGDVRIAFPTFGRVTRRSFQPYVKVAIVCIGGKDQSDLDVFCRFGSCFPV